MADAVFDSHQVTSVCGVCAISSRADSDMGIVVEGHGDLTTGLVYAIFGPASSLVAELQPDGKGAKKVDFSEKNTYGNLNLDDASRLDYDRRYGDNHALRHAAAYRALTRRTDPHLGWMHLAPIRVKCGGEDRDGSGYYSVRERSPFKDAFPGEVLNTRASFSVMAEQ